VPLHLADLPRRATLMVSTDPDRPEGDVGLDGFTLRPNEGVILRL
jgi:hypothetical protein